MQPLLPTRCRSVLIIVLSALALIAPFTEPTTPVRAAGIVYVVPGGAGARDGTSWDNARDLQDALTNAATGDELWVKAGIYTPTTGTDRAVSFVLTNGIALYGGFAGSETQRTQRNIAANTTTFSGDLLGNDAGAVSTTNPTRAENSYHVVVIDNGAEAGMLNGVTIVGGNANDGASDNTDGGGLIKQQGSWVLKQVRFERNSASKNGGGFCNLSHDLQLDQLTFVQNDAGERGGGMYVDASAQVVIGHTTFLSNTADSDGGGLWMFGAYDQVLTNLVFRGNTARNGQGGGMYLLAGVDTVTASVFEQNTAQYGGGLYVQSNRSDSHYTNLTFTDNQADHDGGGMYLSGGLTPVLRDIHFTRNISGSGLGGGAYLAVSSSTYLVHIDCEDNRASAGGGLYLEGNEFHLINSRFLANHATFGGGIDFHRGNLLSVNTIFFQNTAYAGGGISFIDATGHLVNTTFVNNTASGLGNAVDVGSSSPIAIENSILWDNRYHEPGEPDQIAGVTAIVTNTLVQGGYPGVGNLDADPLFVDVAAGDLHLRAGSPMINAGATAALPPDLADLDGDTDLAEPTPLDLDGNARVVGAAVDLGAYEWRPLRISSSVPPSGTCGAAFSHTFATLSGAATWSVTAGALPPGLALNASSGALTGTPTAAGTFGPLTVTASTPQGSDTQSFSIVIAKAALTIIAEDNVRRNGAANPPFTAIYSGFVNGDTPASLATPATLTTSADAGSPMGTYQISVGGATSPNYTITFVNGTLTVTDKQIPTLRWDAPAAITYGTALGAAQLNSTASVPGIFSYTPPLGATLNAGAGQVLRVTFTPDDSAYSSVSASVALDVVKAALVVSADAQRSTYGATQPALTFQVRGFVHYDTATALNGSPACTTSATQASAVGSYPITCGVGTMMAANYTFSFAAAMLNITPAPLTITASSQTRLVGAPNPPLTASYNGFVSGDTPASLSTPVILTTSAETASPMGTYQISVGGATSPNYTITFVNGTLTLTATNRPTGKAMYLPLIAR